MIVKERVTLTWTGILAPYHAANLLSFGLKIKFKLICGIEIQGNLKCKCTLLESNFENNLALCYHQHDIEIEIKPPVE